MKTPWVIFYSHFKNTKFGVQVIHLPVCGWVCPNVRVKRNGFFYHHSRTSLIQRPYSLPKKTDFPCTVLREQCSKNVWDVRELGFIVQWTVAFWITNVNDRATFRKWKVCCILEYTFFNLIFFCVLFISCNRSPWLRY